MLLAQSPHCPLGAPQLTSKICVNSTGDLDARKKEWLDCTSSENGKQVRNWGEVRKLLM
jgi:hypothetical protein